MISLRRGAWQTALADIEQVDATIVDPPYGERTHAKQKHGRRERTSGKNVSDVGITYKPWGIKEIADFCAHWSPRTKGWMCVFTDSEIYPLWRDTLLAVGRYVFAPIPCVQFGSNVRLAGDGPSSWTTWLVVARPRKKWRTLRGAYTGPPATDGLCAGAKPTWMMKQIIEDYTKPGALICDPCAGGGTTLLAAAIMGRNAIGSELDPETYRKARHRLIASGMMQTETRRAV